MAVVPAWLVDALPLKLWKPANLRFRGRLHFCTNGVRTIEWNGRVIGAGKRTFDVAEHWPQRSAES